MRNVSGQISGASSAVQPATGIRNRSFRPFTTKISYVWPVRPDQDKYLNVLQPRRLPGAEKFFFGVWLPRGLGNPRRPGFCLKVFLFLQGFSFVSWAQTNGAVERFRALRRAACRELACRGAPACERGATTGFQVGRSGCQLPVNVGRPSTSTHSQLRLGGALRARRALSSGPVRPGVEGLASQPWLSAVRGRRWASGNILKRAHGRRMTHSYEVDLQV